MKIYCISYVYFAVHLLFANVEALEKNDKIEVFLQSREVMLKEKATPILQEVAKSSRGESNPHHELGKLG